MSEEGSQSATDQLQSALVPDSATKPTPAAAPSGNPGPGTGKLPSGPGTDFSYLDPTPPGSGEGDAAAKAAAAAAAAEGEKGNQTVQAPDWSPEKFLSEKIGDPKDFLTSDKKIKDFAGLREVAGKAMKQNHALELENAQLKAGRTFGGDGDGATMPETDAVKALQGELAALKPEAEAWKEEKARRDLTQNQALRREFDAPRASILRALEATAKEVDLAGEEVKAFLTLDSEFKQIKWVEENVDDETAAGLFKSKGASFLGLSATKADILATEDVFDQLAEWEERELAFGNQMAVKLDDNIARQYSAAAVKVFEKLNVEEDVYFTATDVGKQALSEIQQRFAAGQGFTPEETVLALASAGKGDAFEALSNRFAEQLVEARAEIVRLGGLDPTTKMLGNQPLPPGGGGGSGGGDEIDPFSSGDSSGGVKPLISPEELSKALAGGV